MGGDLQGLHSLGHTHRLLIQLSSDFVCVMSGTHPEYGHLHAQNAFTNLSMWKMIDVFSALLITSLLAFSLKRYF